MYYRPEKGIKAACKALLLCGAFLFMAGCRTLPPDTGIYQVPYPKDARAVASFDADILGDAYIETVRQQFGDETKDILSRADTVDFALFDKGSFSLLLSGGFGRFTTSMALNFSSAWKRPVKGEATWVHADGIQTIHIPESGTVVYGVPETVRMSEAWKNRSETLLARDRRLFIYIPDMAELAPGLPVSGECRIFGDDPGNLLSFSLEWRFPDQRRARTAVPLVKLTLWGFFRSLDKDFDPASLDIRLEEDTLFIDNLGIGAEAFSALVEMIVRRDQ